MKDQQMLIFHVTYLNQKGKSLSVQVPPACGIKENVVYIILADLCQINICSSFDQ